jgi:hypothetical protein
MKKLTPGRYSFTESISPAIKRGEWFIRALDEYRQRQFSIFFYDDNFGLKHLNLKSVP